MIKRELKFQIGDRVITERTNVIGPWLVTKVPEGRTAYYEITHSEVSYPYCRDEFELALADSPPAPAVPDPQPQQLELF